MTKREKAVAVAKDVLKQLRLGRIRVNTGSYIHSSNPIKEVTAALKDNPDCDLKAVVDVIGHKCSVCAKGAAVLSMARLYDRVPLSPMVTTYDIEAGDSTVKQLGSVFNSETLSLMEAAFERSSWYGRSQKSADAESFGRQFAKPADRLRAIMQNIVRNKGRFLPPKAKVPA